MKFENIESRLSMMDFYQLCNKHKWFNVATNEQYDKVLKFVDNARFVVGYSYESAIERIALMTWLCSEGSDIKEIINILTIACERKAKGQ